MMNLKSVIFLGCIVTLFGCDDSALNESANPPPPVKVKVPPKPITFNTVADGDYDIELIQKNTMETSMVGAIPIAGGNGSNHPMIVESSSHWTLHHRGDTYTFKLEDIQYSYDMMPLRIDFDSRLMAVNTADQVKIPGYAVDFSKEGHQQLDEALLALKKVKGFSFTLMSTPASTESQFQLKSDYVLPLSQLHVKDNPYSPDDEINIHLAKDKIVPIFVFALSRPAEGIMPGQDYKSPAGVWTLSGKTQLNYFTQHEHKKIHTKAHFDMNRNLKTFYYNSFYSKTNTIKTRVNTFKRVTKVTHEADMTINPANHP